jgi:hypothetical protein
MKRIIWIFSLTLIPAFFFVTTALAQEEQTFVKKLATPEMCQENNGYWNECPPNDCLKNTPSGGNCSQECGQSACGLSQAEGGPYTKELCADAGGFWNECPPNDCVIGGGENCGNSCGIPVCEFTPLPTSQEECEARDGEWLDCPRIIDCDLNQSEFCAAVCGDPRCRFYPQAGHYNETACKLLGGFWNTKAPHPDSPTSPYKAAACELVSVGESEFIPMDTTLTKEECDEKEGWYWNDCPGVDCIENEGEVNCDACGEPVCAQIDEEYCTTLEGIWDPADQMCFTAIDGVPVSKSLCNQQYLEGWWWNDCTVYDENCTNPRCEMYTQEMCEAQGGSWEKTAVPPCVFAPPAAFPDIKGHQYEKAISYIKSEEIVEGYPDGTYGPNKTINRAEFTKIIIEALYAGEITGDTCFSDVADEWFAKYVCFAKSKGIINGYPDGSFLPENPVNWVEALKISLEAFEFDVPNRPGEWYRPYLMFAEENGLNFITILDKSITRGEMAELIYRIMKM